MRDGKIIAVGSSADMRASSGPGTRAVDLDGRTVIPGLIDSHMHAIRAALFFATEVNWIGARSLDEAMERIARGRASACQPGAVDDRRRRLDAAAVRGAAPADAGRARGRGAEQSGLRAAVLRLRRC